MYIGSKGRVTLTGPGMIQYNPNINNTRLDYPIEDNVHVIMHNMGKEKRLKGNDRKEYLGTNKQKV